MQFSLFDSLYPEFKIDKPVRLIELFGGIGSQAKALERLNVPMEPWRLVEIDKHAVNSYNAIHGTQFSTTDITQMKGEDLGVVDIDDYCYIMTWSFPCFPAGTLVYCETGLKPIECVEKGERVLTHEKTWETVLWSGQTGVKQLYSVSSMFGTVKCTGNHLFYLLKKGSKIPAFYAVKDVELYADEFYCGIPVNLFGETVSPNGNSDLFEEYFEWLTKDFNADCAKHGIPSPQFGYQIKEDNSIYFFSDSQVLFHEMVYWFVYRYHIMPECYYNEPIYEFLFDPDSKKSFCSDGILWFELRKIEELEEVQPVYDICVDNAHSFIADGHLVHNCTSLSVAGLRQGMSESSGTASSLIWEVRRLLMETPNLPQVLLMENVPQVIDQMNVGDLNIMRDFLESKGYSNYLSIMKSSDYGVPQGRARAFMVSLLGDYSYSFPDPVPLLWSMGDCLDNDQPEKLFIRNAKAHQVCEFLVNEKFAKIKNIRLCGRLNEHQAGGVYHPTGVSPTLTAGGANQVNCIVSKERANA